ncbi:hypothetical protein FACS189494_10720 [Spirochaetia bacterium]|nr:hypothetical protein FACS189494_10720 [Spirochaetia bacterium]
MRQAAREKVDTEQTDTETPVPESAALPAFAVIDEDKLDKKRADAAIATQTADETNE